VFDNRTYYLWKQPTRNHTDYLVAAASISLRTPGQSYVGAFVSDALRTWKPNRIVLLGIAGSLDPNLQLGDVVVPDIILGYEVHDAQGSKSAYRPVYNYTGSLDMDRVRALRMNRHRYAAWKQSCADSALGVKTSRPPELHLEAVASGNSVVKSVSFGNALKKMDKRIKAVEMEAYGMHQALYLSASNRADALMIRGISDFADRRKSKLERTSKDGWRTYAAANAARLLNTLWMDAPVESVSEPLELNVAIGPQTRFAAREIPRIMYRHVGAQNVSFPALLLRHSPTPELKLTVAVNPKDVELQTVCVQSRPEFRVFQPKVSRPGTIQIVLPASESGVAVELLLSFARPVDDLQFTCTDDFGRIASENRTFRRKANGN
jgi:nucleoside phosphorylase